MIELMILVVIIGILAAIGVPAYQKYVIKARMAEGYQNIGVITRKEICILLRIRNLFHYNP